MRSNWLQTCFCITERALNESLSCLFYFPEFTLKETKNFIKKFLKFIVKKYLTWSEKNNYLFFLRRLCFGEISFRKNNTISLFENLFSSKSRSLIIFNSNGIKMLVSPVFQLEKDSVFIFSTFKDLIGEGIFLVCNKIDVILSIKL